MARFIKAESGPKESVIYIDDSGKRFQYSGGDRNWRNNNPGNLKPGDVSKRNGQIGSAGGFAVFPDAETGHVALLDSLKNAHGNKDLSQMIGVFAPKFENNTARYLRFLRKRSGVKDNKKIKDFTSSEFELLWQAIESMEGKRKPSIREIEDKKKITKVRKDKKGTITAYFVEGMGWLSKQRGIELARSDKIDAVISISSAGNPFLKTRPDTEVENNLDYLG